MLKVNAKTGQVYLYGVIGGEDIGGDIAESDVIDALDSIKGRKAILHLNSPGGSVDAGIAIHSILTSYVPGVEVVNDGMCASIATVIAMAADVRKTTIGSRWMIHRVRGGVYGTVSQIEQRIAQMKAYDAATEAIYMNTLAIDQEQLASMLDVESWFSADDAVKYGLATEKIGAKATARPKIASWFQNAPAELIAACAGEEVVSVYPWKRELAKLRARI